MAKLSAVVDDLGRLKAEISELTERKAELEQVLKDSGEDAVDGRLFRATISRFTRAQVAWKKIAEKLGASRQMITANTTDVEIERVDIHARKAA